MQPRKALREVKFYIGNPIIALVSGRLLFGDDKLPSKVLAVISVPDSMDVQETLHYFTEKEKLITSARILKTEFTRHYSMVFNFETEATAEEFYEQYANRPFSLLVEDKIIIKKVESILTDHYLEDSFEIVDNPKVRRKESERYLVVEDKPSAIFNLTENWKSVEQEKSEFVIKETELHSFKDCPICLETFEESSHTITILCSHKFHYKCLSEWRDQTCPVCRYQQYPFELTFCESCDIHQDLWCCIICGYIGCGGAVPVSGHIRDHAAETNHIYSKPIIKELKNSRAKGIFDHSTNDFIHSVAYNSGLGIVASEASPSKKDKKQKDVNEEINELISATLDNQRQYYQAELAKLDDEVARVQRDSADTCKYVQSDIDALRADIAHMDDLLADSKESLASLTNTMAVLNEKLAAIKKENLRMKKAKKQKEEELAKLRENKREELAAIKKEIAESLAEIKDMKLHIDNSKKIEALPVQKGSSIMILETGLKKSKK